MRSVLPFVFMVVAMGPALADHTSRHPALGQYSPQAPQSRPARWKIEGRVNRTRQNFTGTFGSADEDEIYQILQEQ